jgi:hypothetical protein
MCSLFINDLDAGAGRMGDATQYTVNNQMVNATLMNIADNPTNVQLPGVYKEETIPRVPIICTGAARWRGRGRRGAGRRPQTLTPRPPLCTPPPALTRRASRWLLTSLDPPPPPPTPPQVTTSPRSTRPSSATAAWRSTTGTPPARTAWACAWASST